MTEETLRIIFMATGSAWFILQLARELFGVIAKKRT
jgi:hypothetical protein